MEGPEIIHHLKETEFQYWISYRETTYIVRYVVSSGVSYLIELTTGLQIWSGLMVCTSMEKAKVILMAHLLCIRQELYFTNSYGQTVVSAEQKTQEQ